MDDQLDAEDETEMSNAEYLRDLSDRLREIPVMYGVDGYDCDRLRWIARDLENMT